MLNTELNDRDIPHRTKIRSEIMNLWGLHMRDLGKKMGVSYVLSSSFYLLIGIIGGTWKDFIYSQWLE